jgi:hypothetical protein
MPQENGAERPLGIPAGDDNVGPLAGATRWMAIAAPAVRAGRDGDRPGRGALAAVRARTGARQDGPSGDLIEADVTGFCAPLDPTRLWTMRRERLEDRAVRRLLRKGLQAGGLEPAGRGVPPETGSPPGGGLSPVRAKVSVPDALDGWVAEAVTTHGRGAARLGREAEDGVGACRDHDEAARCDRG